MSRPSTRTIMAELQLEVEQLKNAYREAVWAKSAVLGAPRQKDDWPQLFVLMPFARALEPIYKRHIKKVASAAQLRVARADDFFGAGSIMKDVWSAINAARVIVA